MLLKQGSLHARAHVCTNKAGKCNAGPTHKRAHERSHATQAATRLTPRTPIQHKQARAPSSTSKQRTREAQYKQWQPQRSQPAPQQKKSSKLHNRLEQLLCECEAAQSESSSSNRAPGSQQASADQGHAALARLQHLAELWALWETAQGQAERLKPLAAPTAPPAQEPARSHVAPPPALNTAHPQHSSTTVPATSPPPDLHARVEACACSLLHTLSLTVGSAANAANPPLSDLPAAVALLSAMAALRLYDARLCTHVECVVTAYAAAEGVMDLRQAARVLAAWAKLGHRPGSAAKAAMLQASGAAMRSTSPALTAPQPCTPPSPTSSSSSPLPHAPHIAAVKLESGARALADLAWAVSQLGGWGSWRGLPAGQHASSYNTNDSSSCTSSNKSSSSSDDSRPASSSSNSMPTGHRSMHTSPMAAPPPAPPPLNVALLLLPQFRPPPPSVPLPQNHSTTASLPAAPSAPTPPHHSGSPSTAEASPEHKSSTLHDMPVGRQPMHINSSITTPAQLAQTQQLWLRELHACSLPHLRALNLAGLARLLQAAAAMHMRPSQSWLQAAAASVLAATPELHAPQVPAHVTPPLSLPTPQPTAAAAAVRAGAGVPPTRPMPTQREAQTAAADAERAPPPAAAVSEAPTGYRSYTQPLTTSRMANFISALEGLAELWVGPWVARCTPNREGVLRVTHGSPLPSHPPNSEASTGTEGPQCEDALADLQPLVCVLNHETLPHMGAAHLAPLLWSSVSLGAGPKISPQAIQVAMERLHGHLPVLSSRNLVLALHAAAMLGLRPYRSWMADWQQQFLRHYSGLSCTDTVRVVCALAVLHPPSTKLGDPITAALVDRLSYHMPALTRQEIGVTCAAVRQLYRRLRGRPLQQLMQDLRDREGFIL